MITYRLEKGSALTILELDANFRELEQRINAQEDRKMCSAITAEQQGDLLILKADSQTISQVVLPKFQPIFKGAWQQNTPYHPGCWAQFNNALYACQTYHLSGEKFEVHFWQLIFNNEGDANA